MDALAHGRVCVAMLVSSHHVAVHQQGKASDPLGVSAGSGLGTGFLLALSMIRALSQARGPGSEHPLPPNSLPVQLSLAFP